MDGAGELGADSLRQRAFDLRQQGFTYVLIEKTLAITYLEARELGRAYDAEHGRPRRIVRRLRRPTEDGGPIRIPARDLRNDSARILRLVEAGQRFRITVSGREVAELAPAATRSEFASRSAVERILREAPLDPGFAADLATAVGQRIDEL